MSTAGGGPGNTGTVGAGVREAEVVLFPGPAALQVLPDPVTGRREAHFGRREGDLLHLTEQEALKKAGMTKKDLPIR